MSAFPLPPPPPTLPLPLTARFCLVRSRFPSLHLAALVCRSASIAIFFKCNAKDLEPHGPTEEEPVQKPVLGGLFSSKIQNFAFVSVSSSRSREERKSVGLKGEIVLSRDGDSGGALSVFVALALHAAPHLSVPAVDLRPTQRGR